MQHLKGRVAVLVLLLFVAASAQASVIVFDNLGPDDECSTSSMGWFGTTVGGVEYQIATDFVASATGKVTDIWAALFKDYGLMGNVFTLSLHETEVTPPDVPPLPGAALWEETHSDILSYWEEDSSPIHLSVVDGPILEAGERYWLWAQTTDSPNISATWRYNVLGDMGYRAEIVPGSYRQLWPDQVRYAFRIGVEPVESAVPEPATISLLALGGLGLLRRRKRR